MDRQTQFANDLRVLRVLCDESTRNDERRRLIQQAGLRPFQEPEHQVVFESICALHSRGSISLERLRVHLNNRGFPDTDVEKYFQAEQFPAVATRHPEEPAS